MTAATVTTTQAAHRAQADPDDHARSAQSRALKVIGSVIAPTTVLTALLFYFGRLHATWFFDYFGVNFTVMGLTTQDYLIRAADGLFIPLAVAAGAGLLFMSGYQLLRDRLSDQAWQAVIRVAIPLSLGVGLILIGFALVVVSDPPAFYDYPAVPGLSLAIGVLLVSAAERARRSRARGSSQRARHHELSGLAVAEWGAAFLLVSAGMFWAVNDYSGSVGVARALEVEASLAQQPNVLVYSKQSLNLQAPGVRQVACGTPEAAFGFRYDGLKLVLEVGNQYFLLPADWSAADRVAIVIPRSDALRLEFRPAGNAPSATC
jgi:multisubunit Na+/H+ antiporter MnhB subunit